MSDSPQSSQRTPIRLPRLDDEATTARVAQWLVQQGDTVCAGDRVVEILLPGILFDVSAPVDGVVESTAVRRGREVSPGDVLGWITNAKPA